MRYSITSMETTIDSTLSYYSIVNKQLLGVMTNMNKLCSVGDIESMLSAYANFLKGKESAGIERAVLSYTFSNDRFGTEKYKKFVELVTEQNT